MAKVDKPLWAAAQQHPRHEFFVIVRTVQDAAPLAEACRREGLTVHQQYRLVPGLALTATGAAIIALAADPTVLSIEPDQEVWV